MPVGTQRKLWGTSAAHRLGSTTSNNRHDAHKNLDASCARESILQLLVLQQRTTAWHSDFDSYGRHVRPQSARQKQESSRGYQTPDARGPEVLFVNKSADETPRGWYCACCSTSEPPMPMYMFLYARFSPCQSRNRFLDSLGMAGRAMQGQLPKNQSHVLIPSPPTARRLEHKGGTLGLLVTTIPSVRFGPSMSCVTGLRGTAVSSWPWWGASLFRCFGRATP